MDADGVFLGSSPVDKLYLGTDEVWSRTPPGLWVAAGWAFDTRSGTDPVSAIQYSTDHGRTWIRAYDSKFARSGAVFSGIAYGNGVWVVTGTTNTFVTTDPTDETLWTESLGADPSEWVSFGEDPVLGPVFVTASSIGRQVMISPDAQPWSWVPYAPEAATATIRRVVRAGNRWYKFDTTSLNNTKWAYSLEGPWNSISFPVFSATFSGKMDFNSSTGEYRAISATQTLVYSSANGNQWVTASANFGTLLNSIKSNNAPTGVQWMAVGNNQTAVKGDSSTWTVVPVSHPTNPSLLDLDWGVDKWIFGGGSYLASYNPNDASIVELTQNTLDSIYCITYGPAAS